MLRLREMVAASQLILPRCCEAGSPILSLENIVPTASAHDCPMLVTPGLYLNSERREQNAAIPAGLTKLGSRLRYAGQVPAQTDLFYSPERLPEAP